jgi:ATP-dependent Clp protease ATP-binding subunit ClpA
VVHSEAISATVEWSVRYLPDFCLPDKALDLLDTACAQVRFLTFSGGASPQCVDRAGIAAAVASRCKIPAGLLTADENERLATMEEKLDKLSAVLQFQTLTKENLAAIVGKILE